MREIFMFMPGAVSGSVDLDVQEGKPIFVRYSKEMAGARVVGTQAIFKERNELQVATEEQWRARE
jgi:hypothetical protein